MKTTERSACEPADRSRKDDGKARKSRAAANLCVSSNWPKVMISRNHRVEKTEVLTEISPSSSRQRADGEQEEDGGGDSDVEHLSCDEKEEEQGICRITSSSEIEESPGIKEATAARENGSKTTDELAKEKENRLLPEGIITKSANEEKPIFVDLTTDEKSTRRSEVLANEEERGTKNRTAAIATEPQIMIADSSSKSHTAGSLATALRDRGPYLIPVQPNRSLPILPAPLPTRSFRKNCCPALLILPKPANPDVVEVESAKSIGATSEESIGTQSDAETPAPKIVAQISYASNLRGTKKKCNDGRGQEKDCAKENKRRKKSHEADSSQGSKNGLKNSLNDFLSKFCGTSDNSGPRNRCADKCTGVVSTTGCKNKCYEKLLVPPLRLKKVARTETKSCDDSLVAPGTNHESNYQIIKDKSSCLRPNPNSTACNLFHEKETNPKSLNNNNCKVMYRRNRLKQKLCELRTKAEDLAKLMAADSSSQQNTRLRQVMNRYEKQIENLSKLHSKLSVAFPSSDQDDDPEYPSKVEYISAGSDKNENESVENKPPLSASPEPPKLSPRSSTSYENIPPEEVRNSPPILPRICLAITSTEDGKFQISESKIWPVTEKLMDQTASADSVGDIPVKTTTTEELHSGECERISENGLNIEVNDFQLDKKYVSHSDNIVQLFDDGHPEEKKNEEKHVVDENDLSPGRLVIHEEEKMNSIHFPDSGPVISSMSSGLEAAAKVSSDIFEPTSSKNILRTDSHEPNQKQTRTEVSKVNQNVQQVTSSSNQSIQIQFIEAPSIQEIIALQPKCKREKPSIDAAQENTSNYTMTEQFPTFGKWVAQMSKNVGARPLNGPIDNPSHVSTSKMQKSVPPNVSNDIMNTNLQYGNEPWQYYPHQQQRPQRLLQHPAPISLAQPVPMVPSPYRPAVYPPPMSINQYYPNNYAMDPYNTAPLNYHPAIYSYGSYPFHPRLYPPSLPGYQFPMQEGLRPMQHPDKRYPSLQEPTMKYSSSIANNLQPSSALPPDRLRGNINGNNVGMPGLPPHYLPPPPLPSPQQSLSGPILPAYAPTNQLSRNRMIPDVVAAAAAAAVVAAASIGKQSDLACNIRQTDLSNATIANIRDSDTPCAGSSSKTEVLHVNNQLCDSAFSENIHQSSTKYQRMQNYLFDRLNLVTKANDFMQPGPTSDNQLQMTASNSSKSRRILPSLMTIAEQEFRNCETPNLGKVNHSPNSLPNLVCSNCGTMGPKFKCLGCEKVFYCDGRCQQKHWALHVRRCPKTMPKLKKLS